MKTYSLIAGSKHQTTRCVHVITVRNSDVIAPFPKIAGCEIASMPEMPKATAAFAITTIRRLKLMSVTDEQHSTLCTQIVCEDQIMNINIASSFGDEVSF